MKATILTVFMIATMFCSVWVSARAQDNQAPPAPGNLILMEKTHNSITIKWDNVSNDGGMMGYLVFIDGAQEPDTIKIGDFVSYTDDYPKLRTIGNNSDHRTLYYTGYDLDPNTSYLFEVAAIDSALNVSSKSPSIQLTTEASAQSGKLVLYPSDDATIIGGSGNYMTFNTGDWPLLFVRSVENFDGWQGGGRPFVKFDISKVEGTITSAKLRMFANMYRSVDWYDAVYDIWLAFYKVGADWNEKDIVFANVPDEDIGADLEGDTEKDAILNRDTVALYTPVSLMKFTNNPAKLGIPAPSDGGNIDFTWHEANFKPYMDAEIANNANEISFTIVDTTFAKYSYVKIFSKDAPANRLQLVLEGTFTGLNEISLKNKMNIYPNPVSQDQVFCFEAMEVDNYQLQIFDVAGKLRYTSNIKNTNKISFNVSGIGLQRGMFIMKATNSKGESGAISFIVD